MERMKPWNQLGRDISTSKNVSEAIYQAGLTWDVEPKPIYVNDKVVDKYFANVRNDDESVLGIVTGKYKIVQNSEAFSFVDGLLDYDAKFVRAGEFHNGRSVWLLAEMPEKQILDDKFGNYICFVNSFDGSGAIKVCCTPVRLICSNTLNLALKTAQRTWSTVHAGNIETKLEEAKFTLGLANNYMTELEKEAERLVTVKMSDADFEHIFDTLYPIDKLNDSERKIRNVLDMKEELFRCTLANDIRVYSGTQYFYINALTDYVAHSIPKRLTQNYQENNWGKIMNGHTMVDNFYKAML